MVYLIFTIIISIISVILTLAIIFQESKSYGLSASITGGSANNYWSGSKSKSKQGRLVRITTIAAIIFFVVAILLNVGLFVNL